MSVCQMDVAGLRQASRDLSANFKGFMLALYPI